MNQDLHERAQDNRPLPRRSAWGLSLLVHVALLLIIGLSWQTVRPGLVESDRAVGIVLARPASTSEVDYLDEEEASELAQAARPTTEALDGEDRAALEFPDIQLPGVDRPDATANLPGNDLQGSQVADRLPGIDDLDTSTLERPARPAGPAGPRGEVSLFGSPQASGRTFAFVIDRSKSMGGQGLNALAAAGKQLDLALGQLQENHRFQVIAYHEKPVYFPDRSMARAIPENQQRLKAFFSQLVAFGATDHELAVLAGLRVRPDVLFLLSDGDSPELGRPQLDSIRKRTGGLTAIHCIQFGFGPLQDATPFMRQLASENRGQFHYVDMRKR